MWTILHDDGDVDLLVISCVSFYSLTRLEDARTAINLSNVTHASLSLLLLLHQVDGPLGAQGLSELVLFSLILVLVQAQVSLLPEATYSDKADQTDHTCDSTSSRTYTGTSPSSRQLTGLLGI